MGVQSITKGMDKQDAYIIKNAFSGLYYMVNVPTGYAVDKKIFPAIFGGPPGIPISNTDSISPLMKEAFKDGSSNTSGSSFTQTAPLIFKRDR